MTEFSVIYQGEIEEILDRLSNDRDNMLIQMARERLQSTHDSGNNRLQIRKLIFIGENDEVIKEVLLS